MCFDGYFLFGASRFPALAASLAPRETLVVHHLRGGLDRDTFRKYPATTHSLKARSMVLCR